MHGRFSWFWKGGAIENISHLLHKRAGFRGKCTEAVLGSRNTEGVTVPTDVEVGTAELITKDGVQVWDVPVYVNGTRVGDGYVKQKQSPEGRLEASNNITVTGTRG